MTRLALLAFLAGGIAIALYALVAWLAFRLLGGGGDSRFLGPEHRRVLDEGLA